MRGLGILSIVLVGVTSVVVAAGDGQSRDYSGDADYQVYCASCHGAGAKGDGPIAKSVKRRPADLTLLTKANKGVFPDDRVFTIIEGRTPGLAHKDSDMPAWGEVFAKAQESSGAEATKARITALVKYLERIQEK